MRDTATSQLCIFFQMTGMWKWHRLTAVQNFCFKYKIKLSGTRLRNSCKQRLDHNHILLTRGNKTCRYQENTPAKKNMWREGDCARQVRLFGSTPRCQGGRWPLPCHYPGTGNMLTWVKNSKSIMPRENHFTQRRLTKRTEFCRTLK